MTAHNIFETISSQYFQLTNSEKKVADYVLRHRIDVQYMSISELAEECTVADATISRFCRKLELAKASMTRDSHRADAAILQESSGFHAMCKKLLGENVAVLEQTIQLLDPRQVSRAVDLLRRSRRVVCMGQGSSMVLSEEAWTLFSTVSPKFLFVPDSHLQMNTLALMDPDELVLFFSYSGSTRDFQDLLEVARQRQVKVVLVSRFPKSPGGQLADVVLQCGADEGPLQAGSVNARMAQLFVLDVLFQEFCMRAPEETEQSREQIAEAVARKHL